MSIHRVFFSSWRELLFLREKRCTKEKAGIQPLRKIKSTEHRTVKLYKDHPALSERGSIKSNMISPLQETLTLTWFLHMEQKLSSKQSNPLSSKCLITVPFKCQPSDFFYFHLSHEAIWCCTSVSELRDFFKNNYFPEVPWCGLLCCGCGRDVKFQNICKWHQYYQEAWISTLRKLTWLALYTCWYSFSPILTL